MRNLTKAICVISVLALPLPLAAQQTTRAFDGRYQGVSNELSRTTASLSCRLPPPNPVPPPLTIVNGNAQTAALGDMEGSVNAQGGLVMRNSKNGQRPEGQIDAQARATGQVSGTNCYWRVVWQKAGANAPAR
jgi:hypothetical protein